MQILWIAQVGEGELTRDIECAFARAGRVVLHTKRCGCARYLSEAGIPFDTLDSLYECAEDFDQHARMAADDVLSSQADEVVYAVMTLADASVKLLIDCVPGARVIGGGLWGELWARADGPTLFISASDWQSCPLTADANTIVTEIDSQPLASEIKLKLMEIYPETSEITIMRAGREVVHLPLVSLDRVGGYDHRFGCLIRARRALTELERFDFRHLCALVRALRDPETGCAWDAKQDHESLARAAIEEAYELEDAIDTGDAASMCEELGDILFICALNACVAEAHGEFTMEDVITGVSQKMIKRHPHVFGGERVTDDARLREIWTEAKKEEKHFDTPADAMNAVAKSLPSLTRAEKVFKIARDAKIGVFDAPSLCAHALDAVEKFSCGGGEACAGEALYVCAKLCAALGIDPEKALSNAINQSLRAT